MTYYIYTRNGWEEDHMNNILVITHPYAERKTNYELISEAHNLSFNNATNVNVFIMEKYSEELVQSYQKYGGENFLIHEVDKEQEYIYYVELIVRVCKEYKPDLVLYPGTDLGKAISASVATILQSALIADCVDIQILDDNKYCFSRAAMNSSIIAKIRCSKDCIHMCTVKKNVFDMKEVEKYEKLNIRNILFDRAKIYEDKIEILDITENKNKTHESDIENAKIIFGIGKGVSREDITKIEDLAKIYHAEIGCTRTIVEESIMDKTRQIGQSGKMVSPDIYIAFGISGASQHMIGLKNAKTIIAINRDEHAVICKYADYVIVADTHDIITSMYSKMIGEYL